MRTSYPTLLPLFRSEMQVRLLALLLLQSERSWTLQELASALDSPASSVHRELGRAEGAGIVVRDAQVRPHRFAAATGEPMTEPLAVLLRQTVGLEQRLRTILERPGVEAAVIHGSWAAGGRRPDSDVDVLVVGAADLRELRRAVRPIAKEAGRRIDLTVLSPEEFRRLRADGSSFVRGLLEGPLVRLAGDLATVA
jgi:predicted nucleotidyltransferase